MKACNNHITRSEFLAIVYPADFNYMYLQIQIDERPMLCVVYKLTQHVRQVVAIGIINHGLENFIHVRYYMFRYVVAGSR